MIPIADLQVISGAWTDILLNFIKQTRSELLVMSPWITSPVAKLISHGLANVGTVKLQILARFAESDFLSGASHTEAFKPETYPSNARPEFRALPLLHGKMLISDRERLIVGSANMTDGGLYRNHEICLQIKSSKISKECAEAFFKYWQAGSAVPSDYIENIESLLEDALPTSDEEQIENTENNKSVIKATKSKAKSFKYVKPAQSASSRLQLTNIISLEPPMEEAPEEKELALKWLTGGLRTLKREERSKEYVITRIERLMYHPDISVRSTAIDRAGRNGILFLVPRLQTIATNVTEPMNVRSAAAFSLGLIGSPHSVSVLANLSSTYDDVGRWARRGCFLLLDTIQQDEQLWLLNELNIQEQYRVIEIAKRCQLSSGSPSVRLTKALIIEKYFSGVWNDSEIQALACIMMQVGLMLKSYKKPIPIGPICRAASTALNVAPGDLRHGPLSPSLLKSITSQGLSNSGLVLLLGSSWSKLTNNEISVGEVLSAPHFFPVLYIIGQYELENTIKNQ